MSSVQPAGTVTLVFTDIEGSTRLLARLGEEGYRDALAEHRRVVREAFARYAGYEVDYEGDAFFYAFASALDALAAVQEAGVGLEQGPVRIRVGVHTGEPLPDPPKYVGLDVHKAARIMAAGHGGQVLVSAATQQLAGSRVRLRDLGLHSFKDFPSPERLFQLGDADHPPPRTLERSNLPLAATAFLGRKRELATVVDLLEGARLVTLTGPGGTGKTRLALAAADESAGSFPGGTWWVPLASLASADLVLGELGQALGLDVGPGLVVAGQLESALRGRRMLLVLDNAEQLLPTLSDVVAALLQVAGPTLLVTSRERLQLAAEQVYAVPPLTDSEGVELFVARARSLDPAFEESPALDELCARLDNLPLALELAAARTGVLSPKQILARLAGRLDLLKGTRDADPRQRTLRSTIAWSYELLTPEERELFAALGVFSGGCRLEAAEAICDADLDTVATLVDKSLVRRSGERYWMLETIRQFALERLLESGRAHDLLLAHATYFERFAQEGEVALRTTAQRHWLELLAADQPNLRAAIEWSLEHGLAGAALRTSSSAYRFWGGASGAEGRMWLGRALATGAGSAAERAKASFVAGQLALLHGEHRQAVELLDDAVSLADAAGERDLYITSLGWSAWAAYEFGARAHGEARLAECRSLVEEVNDAPVLAEVLTSVAAVAGHLGDHEEASRLFRRVLELERAIGDELSVADALNNLGYTAWEAGEHQEARVHLEECLEIARRHGDELRITMAVGNLGLVALTQRRYEDAAGLLRDELALANRRGNRRSGIEALIGLAGAWAALGDTRLAVRLLAAAEGVSAAGGLDHAAANRTQLVTVAPLVESAAAGLDGATRARLEAEGRALTPEQALELVERRTAQ